MSSCSVISAKPAPPLHTYALGSGTGKTTSGTMPATTRLVLLIEVPRALPGYAGTHMIYERMPMQPEPYANSVWIDTPAHMLAPLLQARLAQSGDFHAVVLTPSAAKVDLRLDSTIIRLQQDFASAPSTERFGLQLTLIDEATRAVLASHTLEVNQPALTEDAAGGAFAANSAVQQGLDQAAIFVHAALAALPAD
jgi:cholesterol transport system auxiliary component